MPFYTWLRPRSYDSSATTATKRRAARKLRELRTAIKQHLASRVPPDGVTLPAESSRVLRLATWNLREFDSSSWGWRTQEAKAYIAEILAHFDLIALQEIRRDLDALDDVQRLLGPNWSYIATDVTDGSAGNKERMAFLFDSRNKVRFCDVAGELTLPQRPEDLRSVRRALPDRRRGQARSARFRSVSTSPTGLEDRGARLSGTQGGSKTSRSRCRPAPSSCCQPALVAAHPRPTPSVPAHATTTGSRSKTRTARRCRRLPRSCCRPNSLVGGERQFARTPFVASFQAGWLKLNLATVHIYYGKGDAGMERRKEEIRPA